MAEIAAGFAGAAIELAKLVAQPIKRQFNYLCCFTSNIDGLQHEAEELDLATREVQGRVDRETENLRVIVPEVSSWFDKCRRIKEQKETILDKVPNVKEGCLKLRARFSLSRRAKKAIDLMKELRGQKNFDPVAMEGPPAATQETPLGRAYEFESRKKLEQNIIATLRDGDVNIIGICGMGGLGKTTMAQRIMNRVLKEHVFEEVVMTVISQQVDRSNVQVEIGGSLGLNLQHDTSQVRVQKLHARLTGTKRILLVLDDVREGLELESLGIPRGSNGCKILVTSRNKDALSEMDAKNVFGMEVLTPKDAWFLFRERAGTCVDDKKLYPIAKEVIDECGGLPIALTAVGAALKDEKDASIWKEALRQLRQCDQDIPNFIEKVYNPLRLSYDFLGSQQEKSLLLLCCLFREDAQIPLDQLTYFCMGLGIFEGTMNLERSRNKVRSLAKMLKSSSLLLDGFNEYHVRMHDDVRDVCKIIAKHEKYIGGNDCACISSSEPEMIGEISEFPTRLRFPNLRLLLLTGHSELTFGSVFLEGINDLHVLWIEYSTLTSLPHGRQPLRNLKTLVINSCADMKTISVVGELINLEILICRNCHSLEELPSEIKGLNRLKLLELTHCYGLQSIGRGIISSLVGLEELKMFYSFNKWEAEDREEKKNAGLREIGALINLTCLEIQIEDPALVAENMQISAKLQRFHIEFHDGVFLSQAFYSCDRKMNLQLERETCLGHWIEMQLLIDTQSLSLRGNGTKSVDLRSQNIKWLKLGECETTKNIVTTSSYDNIVDATVFPASLKYMDLYSLPQLQEISYASFQNLTFIKISKCPRLPNLAKLSIAAKDCLSQLEKLSIEQCEMIEQVLLWKEEEDNNSESKINPQVKFPKLKEVWLDSLPNLATFCQGIEGIEFPLLRKIWIEKCPKWTSMVSCSSSNEDIHDEYSSHLFCQLEKASFGNLRELILEVNPFCDQEIPVSSSYSGLTKLSISNYHGSRSLFSCPIATNLVNLKELRIKECDEIVQVIKDDDDDDEEKTSHVLADANGGKMAAALFPKLEELSLKKLPKLVSFCEWKRDVVLPSLRRADIMKCPNMKKLSLGFVAAPNLEAFPTDLSHDLELGVNFSFDRLKKLWIGNSGSIEYPFYDHKFFVSLVDGVEELELYGHQSRNLFSSSIAGKLANLRSLRINSCLEMVKVIEEEEDEVVSSGRTTLLFPKLEELELEQLYELVSFCEVKCVVALPSLRKVTISYCPTMERFSLGPLTTPNLKSIEIDYKDISGDQRDLNGALQQHYSKRAKERKEEEEKEEEEEEGGQEERGSMGEIEEDNKN